MERNNIHRNHADIKAAEMKNPSKTGYYYAGFDNKLLKSINKQNVNKEALLIINQEKINRQKIRKALMKHLNEAQKVSGVKASDVHKKINIWKNYINT